MNSARFLLYSLLGSLALTVSNSLIHAEPTAPVEQLEGIIGPALYVTNPARSLKFYTEGLGMKVRMRFGPAGRPDAVVGFGVDPTGAAIMLITDKEGPIRPIQHAHGFDRIALRLPDLAAVSERLRKAGFEPGEVRTVHGNFRMMMISDPDGYLIELIDSQSPANHP